LTKGDRTQEEQVAKYNLQDKYRLYYIDGTKWKSTSSLRNKNLAKETMERTKPVDDAYFAIDASVVDGVPKNFTVVFPFPSRYATAPQLAAGVLDGVYGISDHQLGIMHDMLSVVDKNATDLSQRTAALVMDGPATIKLNQLSKVDYTDAESLLQRRNGSNQAHLWLHRR
jgi:hypothetical protein